MVPLWVLGTTRCTIGTLNKRWEAAIRQMQKLRCVPATIEAKTKNIHATVYGSAMYGIEAAQTTPSQIAKMAAAVIGVFRSRNNDHNVDRFFSTQTSARNELRRRC